MRPLRYLDEAISVLRTALSASWPRSDPRAGALSSRRSPPGSGSRWRAGRGTCRSNGGSCPRRSPPYRPGPKRLVETIAEVPTAARQLVEERLREVGEQLGRLQARLSAVEQEIANLDVLEVDAGWVGRCLADFDAIWDVLTPENRLRLVRAIVQRVEVNEPENDVKVVITDFANAETEPAYEVAV